MSIAIWGLQSPAICLTNSGAISAEGISQLTGELFIGHARVAARARSRGRFHRGHPLEPVFSAVGTAEVDRARTLAEATPNLTERAMPGTGAVNIPYRLDG